LLAKAIAFDLPMPLEAPVTKTCFPWRSMRHHNSNSYRRKWGASCAIEAFIAFSYDMLEDKRRPQRRVAKIKDTADLIDR
jgi:hypothetical protein